LPAYVEWHLRQAWAPILFDEPDPAAAEAARASPVAAAQPSPARIAKRGRRRGDDGVPVSSFRDLLRHLATLTRNTVAMHGIPVTTTRWARPTSLQARAFTLLGIRPT
jgi:hypothetical protein